MVISKSTLSFCLAWLMIVVFASANFAIYRTQKTAIQRYQKQRIALLYSQQQERSLLESQIFQKQPHHVIITEVTPDQQEKINALNNGDKITSVAKTANSCDAYKRPWRQFTNSESCAFTVRPAIGDMKLLVIEYAAPEVNLDDAATKQFLTAFNSNQLKVTYTKWEEPTMRSLKPFFEHEAKKFNVHFTLSIDVAPIKKLNSYVADPYKAFKAGPERTRLVNFFLDELKNGQYDVRDYDAIVVAVFGNSQSTFRSFAVPWIRANVTSVYINPWSLGSAISTMAHETAHDFGTSDQYYEDTGLCQPDAQDEYVTGNHVSLMCQLGRIDTDSPNSAVINKRAAREMGWIQ